jgi:hypothetical protein
MRSIYAMGIMALSIISVMATPSYAQHSIYTGSPNGAYNSLFCPPIPPALNQSFFSGYRCQASGGTLENIKQVTTKPSDLGFVQMDVFALQASTDPNLLKQISIARSDIACEGLWMVTKNPALKSYGDVLGYARRIPFVLPSQTSGSAASFKYLQSIDQEGIGRATNIKYMTDATSVINAVANGSDLSVGFFVQFADPENPNIKLMQEKGLSIIPVVSREITKAKNCIRCNPSI